MHEKSFRNDQKYLRILKIFKKKQLKSHTKHPILISKTWTFWAYKGRPKQYDPGIIFLKNFALHLHPVQLIG